MSTRYFKPIRILHKWLGVACFLFVIVLSVSGILLMHTDSLELSKRMVGGQFLPKKYFYVAETHRSIQSLAFISNNKTPLLFAGTDHGLFRSIDSGKNWVESKQGLFSQDIRALATNPKNPKVIYAGTSKGIFKSEDQGESWGEWFDQASGLENILINDLLVSPKEESTVYAATQGGLFFSYEGGDLWEPVEGAIPKNENINSIQFSAAYPSQLIISTESSIFRSSSNGKSWEKKWTTLPPGVSSLITLKTDPEFIFIGTEKGFYKSFNGGLNWIKDKNKNLKKIFALDVNSTDHSSIFATSPKGLFYSTNSGDTWKDITPNDKTLDSYKETPITQINKILSVPTLNGKGSLLLAGSEMGLFLSKNNGAIWSFIDLGKFGNTVSKEDFKMDLGKLVTEIHTGRFFGSYFYWLVDISSVGMIGLAITGLMVIFYRKKIKKTKVPKKKTLDEEIEIDNIIDMSESNNEVQIDKQKAHIMIEHLNEHLEKCKAIYDSSIS
ncbi:uncharacterized protein METZ01_LOCUS95405, partial [marine metagenome]